MRFLGWLFKPLLNERGQFDPFARPNRTTNIPTAIPEVQIVPGASEAATRVQVQQPGVTTTTPVVPGGFQEQFNQILTNLQNVQTPDFLGVLQQGLGSPLVQALIGPTLAALQPSAENIIGQLTDQFRAAGGLKGGQFGKALSQAGGQIAAQQGGVLANLIGGQVGNLIRGLGLQQQAQLDPIRAAISLLGITPLGQQQRTTGGRTEVTQVGPLDFQAPAVATPQPFGFSPESQRVQLLNTLARLQGLA